MAFTKEEYEGMANFLIRHLKQRMPPSFEFTDYKQTEDGKLIFYTKGQDGNFLTNLFLSRIDVDTTETTFSTTNMPYDTIVIDNMKQLLALYERSNPQGYNVKKQEWAKRNAEIAAYLRKKTNLNWESNAGEVYIQDYRAPIKVQEKSWNPFQAKPDVCKLTKDWFDALFKENKLSNPDFYYVDEEGIVNCTYDHPSVLLDLQKSIIEEKQQLKHQIVHQVTVVQNVASILHQKLSEKITNTDDKAKIKEEIKQVLEDFLKEGGQQTLSRRANSPPPKTPEEAKARREDDDKLDPTLFSAVILELCERNKENPLMPKQLKKCGEDILKAPLLPPRKANAQAMKDALANYKKEEPWEPPPTYKP